MPQAWSGRMRLREFIALLGTGANVRAQRVTAATQPQEQNRLERLSQARRWPLKFLLGLSCSRHWRDKLSNARLVQEVKGGSGGGGHRADPKKSYDRAAAMVDLIFEGAEPQIYWSRF